MLMSDFRIIQSYSLTDSWSKSYPSLHDIIWLEIISATVNILKMKTAQTLFSRQ